MSRIAYLCVACDTDPDGPVPFAHPSAASHLNALWQGVAQGVPALRATLDDRLRKHARPLPIAWLLRADRQISEAFGDPAFAYQKFAALWESELRCGSEIGWHPHVFRWNESAGGWRPWLGEGDDLDVLLDSVTALRRHADVTSARTGWTYHSNRLMGLFERAGIRVDGSPMPGSVHHAVWRHDWSGTPRTPFRPSRQNYRVAASDDVDAVNVCAVPSVVRRLSLPSQAARYAARVRRGTSVGWEAARWQGVLLTQPEALHNEAVAQTLELSEAESAAFLLTYFHAGELIQPGLLQRLVQNVERVFTLASKRGWEVHPTTLTGMGIAAESHLRLQRTPRVGAR